MFVIFELSTFSMSAVESLGYEVLLMNAAVAFCLNISVVYLLKNSSSLIFTLSGVVKDILLIVSSSIIFKTQVSLLQILGYSAALSGITLYNFIKMKRPLNVKTVLSTLLLVTLGCCLVFRVLNLLHESTPELEPELKLSEDPVQSR